VLFGVTLVVFSLIHLTPGDPARGLVTQQSSPEILAQIRHQLGTDQPILSQYLHFMANVLHGDLGHSFRLNESVNVIIMERLPTTLFLVVYACILAVIVGVPIAVLAATKRGGRPDHLVRALLVVTLGLPGFWIGVVLVNYVAVRTGLFPAGGYGEKLAGHIWHLFLPAFTLALGFLAVMVRSLRASLIEVLEIDYVGLARLKGISTIQLYRRHILRNAFAPALTILGLNMSFLLGASVVVEQVYSINGIASTLVTGVLARDYQLVQGITLVFAVIVIIITLTVDVAQVALDPRRTAEL
jgi:ABC-type dipeptide/oligopeptide/nickel transport system permease component